MAVTTFKNIRDNKSGTLLTAITATQATLTLNTGQGASFPAAPFYISCDYEVLLCTAKVGDVFTVTRGVDNTIAAIHAAGSLVEMRSVAALWNDLAAAINAIEAGTNPVGQASTVTNGSVVDASVAANALIALSKLARYPFTNADLASDVPRVNLLVNGGLEIGQRGNGPFSTQSSYTLDRWQINLDGTDTLSVSRDTVNVDVASVAAAACTVVRGTGVGTALQQKLEDFTQLQGRTISLSARVRTATANAARIFIWDNVNLYRYSVYQTGSGAYQTLTVTATIAPNATSIFVGLNFALSCTAYLDNAMLVIGSVPVDYQPLTPADDLARCQRYYEIIGEGVQTLIVRGWVGVAGQALDATIPYKVRKAVMPTVTKVGTWTISNCGQPVIAVAGVEIFRLEIIGTAAGAEAYAFNQNVGNMITVEANP